MKKMRVLEKNIADPKNPLFINCFVLIVFVNNQLLVSKSYLLLTSSQLITFQKADT